MWKLCLFFQITRSITHATVRIESLQVISIMARHFTLLKDHLNLIAAAVRPILLSSASVVPSGDWIPPETRLHAVKCIDMLGHHLNIYMSGDGANVVDDLNSGYAFWESMIPVLVELVQGELNAPLVRAAACDALSNIGSYTYERLPVSIN